MVLINMSKKQNFKSKKLPKKQKQSVKKDLKKKEEEKQEKKLKEFGDLYTENSFQKPVVTSNRKVLATILILSVILGGVAGWLSAKFFSPQEMILAQSDEISQQVLSSNIKTVLSQHDEKITVEEDEKIFEVDERVTPAVVSIFKYKTLQNDVFQDVYEQNGFVGNGLVLTNDGWIVTTNDVINLNNKYIIVTQDNIIYKVEIKKQDVQLGLVYLKVKADNLSVVVLSNFSSLQVGQKTLLINGLEHMNKELLVSRISRKDLQISNKIAQNTENPYLYLSLANNFTNQLSVPVFNLDKEFVGLTTSYNNLEYVIPAEYIENSFNKILYNNLTAPYLGLEYINLASVVVENYNSSGALITKIKSDSPLIKQDIAVGDVVLEVGDYIINGHRNFTNLIQEYKSGDKIKLVILDKETKDQKEVEVVLK